MRKKMTSDLLHLLSLQGRYSNMRPWMILRGLFYFLIYLITLIDFWRKIWKGHLSSGTQWFNCYWTLWNVKLQKLAIGFSWLGQVDWGNRWLSTSWLPVPELWAGGLFILYVINCFFCAHVFCSQAVTSGWFPAIILDIYCIEWFWVSFH